MLYYFWGLVYNVFVVARKRLNLKKLNRKVKMNTTKDVYAKMQAEDRRFGERAKTGSKFARNDNRKQNKHRVSFSRLRVNDLEMMFE